MHSNYCRSGDIRHVLIFAIFAGRTNSQDTKLFYYYSATVMIIREFEKNKHAKMSRSAVSGDICLK